MRLRNITGSREVIADSIYVVQEPQEKKGRWKEVFGNDHPVRIEIGMGKGKFLHTLAKENPDINYIGIEKYSSVLLRAIQKMEERLAADTEENIDNQLLTEVSSRVIGNLRRRADGRNDVESSVQEENLERRFRLAALRSERAELYHLRATREISNETLQKLLHDLDLLEALLIEENQ